MSDARPVAIAVSTPDTFGHLEGHGHHGPDEPPVLRSLVMPWVVSCMALLCRYREGWYGGVLYGQVQGQQLQSMALVQAGQGKMQEMPEGV